MNKEKQELFSRHMLLAGLGGKGQEKLLSARICVIGCGGLGCAALPYLVAAGVGNIRLVDLGEVELSNLQRQILYGMADVGQEKVEVIGRKLRNIAHSSVIDPVAAG